MRTGAVVTARARGATRTRDRAATEARILDAARHIIARDGFGALGVNALAAEAGCDKKLIGRYFDGIEGVVRELGSDVGFWVGDVAVGSGDTYGERMQSLLEAYARALRGNVLLQRALAWELVAPSPALAALEHSRSLAIGRWMQSARGDVAVPHNVDAAAINAIVLAALHYLTLRERTLPTFAGMDIASPSGRARLDAAFAALLQGVYPAQRRRAAAVRSR
jgi:AcrR family transcriptional regulator